MNEQIDVPRIHENGVYTYKSLAKVLRCSVRKLRDTPTDKLPRSQPGKVVIIIGKDVIPYLRSHCRCDSGDCDDELVSEIADDMLSSAPDGVHRLSKRRKP